MKKLFLTIFILLFSFTAAFADMSPKDTVLNGVNEILNLLEQPEFKNDRKNPVVIDKIMVKLFALADAHEFAARTVGASWKTFTQDQKDRMVQALKNMVTMTYTKGFEEYEGGGKIEYLGEISSNNGARVEVKVNFISKIQTYPMGIRMLNKNGKWLAYDIIVEGISLVKNYREQFKEILMKKDPEYLISRIQEKADQLKTQHKKGK